MSEILQESVYTNEDDENIYLHYNLADGKGGHGLEVSIQTKESKLVILASFEFGEDISTCLLFFDFLSTGLNLEGEDFIKQLDLIECRAPDFKDISAIKSIIAVSFKLETVWRISIYDFIKTIPFDELNVTDDEAQIIVQNAFTSFDISDASSYIKSYIMKELELIRSTDSSEEDL